MLLPQLIRTRLGKGPYVLQKASAGVLWARRWMAQTFRHPDAKPKVLFIFGCQRSGTTLLSRIFEGDALACTFPEHSRTLARSDHPLRTRSLAELERIFRKCKGHLIASKPLVESQRATAFLEFFPDSKALWSYRDYRDVVRSFVSQFGRAGVNIMKKIVDDADNWSSESISPASRDLVRRFYHPDIPLNDAAAVFWLVRNALFFEQGLDSNPRVQLCRYDDLVSEPDRALRGIYAFLDLPYPGSHIVDGVHENSRGLGRSLTLDPEIESLCQAMWDRLLACEAGARDVAVNASAL
ncbi:MAG TPA: sulfotransferase [Rhodothermales bacterium]|nr:sulfotransferase [Rhodothermales bacterium]